MRRLLYVAHRVPYPPDKGERVRAFHEIVELAKHFEISLAALTHSPQDLQAVEPLKQWCPHVLFAPAGGWAGKARAAMSLMAGRSATEGFFHSRGLDAHLDRLATDGAFDLVFAYCTSVLNPALRVPARAHVIDFVDVDSQKWLAYAQQSRGARRMLFKAEARAVAQLERRAVKKCQAVFITSQAEADLLGEPSPNVLPIANGVDTEYFSPDAVKPEPAAADGPSLVFTGWMNYRPNVEGVCWFVREVWPALKQQLPRLTFTIVGGEPAPQVQQLASEPGIVVTGYVPDVRPYVRAATVAVVPLRIARGVQNKVLEAMAMAKPVVASPGALTGLDAEPGRDAFQADAPAEWVEHILALTDDNGPTARAHELAVTARRCAVERYNWKARLQPMVEACVRLAKA